MKKSIWLILVFVFASSAFAAGGSCPSGSISTTCFYIAANGADTNSGTTESAPWLHAPGMPNCTSNCAAATPTGGLGFIFRGGDTWHFGNSGLSPYTGGEWALINWNGADASCIYEGATTGCIYWGVDKTWFSGGAWSRPILNGDNPLSTSRVASCTYQSGSANIFVSFGIADVFDNFEVTGFCSSRNPASSGPFTDIMLAYFGPSGIGGSGMIQERNLYIHGWTVTTAAGISNSTVACDMVDGTNNGLQTIDHLVVDGADSDPQVCAWGVFPSFYHMKDSIIRYASQGVGQWCHDIHDNIFEHIYGPDVPTHGNMFECNADANGTAVNQPQNTPNVVYNNTYRHDDPSMHSQVDIWFCPNTVPEYWFNNTVFDLGGEGWSIAGPAGYPGCTNAGKQYMFNNTLLQLTQPCSLNTLNNGTNGQYLTISNEHLIAAPLDTFVSPGCTGRTSSTNVAMTNTVATNQGYTTGLPGTAQSNNCANDTTTPCAPPLASNGTVGAGANDQAYCTALAGYTAETAISVDAANACKFGTTDGCSYVLSGHFMSCPAQTPVIRPASLPWDSGSYEFSQGTGVPAVSFAPPGGLSYPNQAVGTASPSQPLGMTSSGSASLSISSIAASPADYTQTNNCPATLVVGASCQIQVTFKPTALGTRNGSITAIDNAGTQVLPLSGVGIAAGNGTVVSHFMQDCTTGTTCASTMSVPGTVGEWIVEAGEDGFAANLSITFSDSAGNSPTQVSFPGGHVYCNLTVDGDTVGMSYYQITHAGPFTITMADGGHSGGKKFGVAEVTGLGGLDKVACGNPTGTSPSSGNTAATSTANQFLFGFMGNTGFPMGTGTITAVSPYALLDTDVPASGRNAIGDESQNVTSTGAYAAQFTQSSSLEAGVVLGTFTYTGSPPTISSLTVTSGVIGSTFGINGTGLSTTVTLNNQTVTGCSGSATVLTGCIVPAGATSGPVVDIAGGVNSNPIQYTVLPNLISLSVSSAVAGAPLVATGTGFGPQTGIITVGGASGTPTSWSSTSISLFIPAGALTGNVSVTTGGNTSNTLAITILPAITSLSINNGVVGTQVTINGTTFVPNPATVQFNGTTASCGSWTSTSTVCTVPGGATTGVVTLTTTSGTATGPTFTVNTPSSAPSIASLSPGGGVTNIPVAIGGANFGATQGTSTVTFGGRTATITLWGASQILCLVPAGLSPGTVNVVVTTTAGASSPAQFVIVPAASITGAFTGLFQ